MRALTFWNCGGSVIWDKSRLSDAQVERLTNALWDEVIKARAGGHWNAARIAADLNSELHAALGRAKRHRQAAGCVREFRPIARPQLTLHLQGQAA